MELKPFKKAQIMLYEILKFLPFVSLTWTRNALLAQITKAKNKETPNIGAFNILCFLKLWKHYNKLFENCNVIGYSTGDCLPDLSGL